MQIKKLGWTLHCALFFLSTSHNCILPCTREWFRHYFFIFKLKYIDLKNYKHLLQKLFRKIFNIDNHEKCFYKPCKGYCLATTMKSAHLCFPRKFTQVKWFHALSLYFMICVYIYIFKSVHITSKSILMATSLLKNNKTTNEHNFCVYTYLIWFWIHYNIRQLQISTWMKFFVFCR